MIAVTGAAGFIGSNLAHRLAALGRRDLVLVDHPLILAKTANLAGLPDCEFLEHAAFLEELQNGQRPVDAIFHLGACSDTTEQDWSYLLPDQLRPLNLYAKSKNDFDVWVLQQLADARPAPQGWAGLKFFNVYGPREGHKGRMASMVWHTYHQIRESGEVKLFRSTEPSIGDGGQRRDFVYVGDCVDHLLWLWKNPGVRGIFNSGTGQARSFLDLVSNTFRTLGREPKIRFIDMPEDLKNRYQSFTQARMGKLRSAGYPGFPTSLERGIAQYVEWLKSPQPPAPLSIGSGQPWERTGEVATPRG
jgi:ADP-L-glycero-D-manno-heptose 6-epimerase